jgi:hypothetical protein
MADLDDFFAKKDRKKSKGKKFTTTDEIAKKLEETGKKVEKTKKEKTSLSSQTSGQGEEEQGSQVQVSIRFILNYYLLQKLCPFCLAAILYPFASYLSRRTRQFRMYVEYVMYYV